MSGKELCAYKCGKYKYQVICGSIVLYSYYIYLTEKVVPNYFLVCIYDFLPQEKNQNLSPLHLHIQLSYLNTFHYI